MVNSSQVSSFTLSAYSPGGRLKSLYFLLVLLLYVLILFSNLLLMVVICVNRTLHEPMYLFLCSLFLNELYGSTGLFLLLLVQILSDSHTVSAPLCFLQVFCVYSYGGVEFSSFAVMSYDRYLSICFPLQYDTLMTGCRASSLIALSWLVSLLGVVVLVSLIAPLQLCGDTIHKVYCDYYSIVKLACSDTTLTNVYGLIYICVAVFSPVLFILYSYSKILRVCFSGSRQTRQKAVSTCTPHLASLLNFCCGTFFEVVQSRFDMSAVPDALRIFLSLYFLTCQPLFNPVMYGLKLSTIRVKCKDLILLPGFYPRGRKMFPKR